MVIFPIAVFILAAAAALYYLNYSSTCIIAFCAILMITPYIIVKAQVFDEAMKTKKAIRNSHLFSISTAAFIILIIGAMIVFGSEEPKVFISADCIKVTSIYRTKIATNEIVDITLESNLPKPLVKINGFDFGNVKRGFFKSDRAKSEILYIYADKPPFICISTKNNYIILNLKDEDSTKKLYERIFNRGKRSLTDVK